MIQQDFAQSWPKPILPLNADYNQNQPAKFFNLSKTKWQKLKDLLSFKVNTVFAMALIIFAFGIVASTAIVAGVEIGNSQDLPFAFNFQKPASGKVLGLATYGYNQPICQKYTSNCLNYELVSYNGNGWQVRIDYQLVNNITGSIKVNNWAFMDNISGIGSGFTGYDLEPKKAYNFILYKKVGSRLTKLTSLQITAPPAPQEIKPKPTCPPQQIPPVNCFYDYSQNKCGQLICAPPIPAYGYQTVSIPQPMGGMVEGWLEQLTYGSGYAPGSVKIYGWAYNNGEPATVTMTLKNKDTGAEISPELISYDLAKRDDVIAYIKNKTGITNPAAIYFAAKFSNLPAGGYYVQSAKYNGNLFNVHSLVYQPITISSPSGSGYPVLKLTNPSSGQQFVTGQKMNIQWTGDDPSYLVHLYLVPVTGMCGTDGIICSGSLYNIGQNQPNNGQYYWTVSSEDLYGKTILFGNYVVQMSNNRGGAMVQSGVFTINQNTNSIRIGQLININGTIYLVGQNGVYGIPSMEVFNSWAWSFNQIVPANDSEKQLLQIGLVPIKNPNCSSVIDQINGSCALGMKLGISGFGPIAQSYTPGQNISFSVTVTKDSNGNFALPQDGIIVKGSILDFVSANTSNTIQTVNAIYSGQNGVWNINIPAPSTVGKTYVFEVTVNCVSSPCLNSTSGSIPGVLKDFNFTIRSVVNAAPVLSQITPSTGSVGTFVKIYGSNFTPDANKIYLTDSSGNKFYLSDASPSSDGGYLLSAIATFTAQNLNSILNPGSYLLSVENGNGKSNFLSFTIPNDTSAPVLTESLDTSSPASSTIVSGSSDVTIGIFKFSATGEDVVIGSLSTISTGSGDCPISSFKLVDINNGLQVGQTMIADKVTCNADWQNVNLSIVRNTSKILSLRADVLQNIKNSNFRFTLFVHMMPYASSGKIVSMIPSSPTVYSNNINFVQTLSNVRSGSIINKNGTVYLVGSNGLYGFPDLATFQSWGFTFEQIVTANSSEMQLLQIGLVPMKNMNCSSPLNQIAGNCSSSVPTASLNSSASSIASGQNLTFAWNISNMPNGQSASFMVDCTSGLNFYDVNNQQNFTCGNINRSVPNIGSYTLKISNSNTYAVTASGKLDYKANLPLNAMVIIGGSTTSASTSTATTTATTTATSTLYSGARVGKLIVKNDTVYYVAGNGLLGIPDINVFNSWGWGFGLIMPANSVELTMPQIGVVPTRISSCATPTDQIAGVCSK